MSVRFRVARLGTNDGAGESAILVKALVAGEEERPLTGERSAEVSAVLIPVQRRLVHIGWIEVVPGVERIVAVEFEAGTAEVVRSRAGHRGDDAAAAPAVLGAVVVDEHLELANGFNTEQAAGCAAG